MRPARYVAVLAVTLVLEIALCLFLFNNIGNVRQDAVAVNECVKSVEINYPNQDAYSKELDYVLLSEDGTVLYSTRDGLSESINEAVSNGDTILDIDGIGKILIHNSTEESVNSYKNSIIAVIVASTLIQVLIIVIYLYRIKRTLIDPFKNMNEFAVRVAGGDLDIPLMVDGKHVFGEFTEAFDLMRTELKKARLAEREANEAKKELVAKLSHDIKTPVASIKSASEVGYEITKEDKTKEYFNQINVKADQIKVLVDNLFNSSVQDVTAISVSAVEYSSDILAPIIRNSDYLGKASSFEVPSARIYVDKLRIQQVFDNLFMNSYKYADTDIEVSCDLEDEYLVVSVRDKGPGVSENELPLLREKYKRGSNSDGKDGAGLGLYLTDYFMNEMDGRLVIENAAPGLKVSVYIRVVEG